MDTLLLFLADETLLLNIFYTFYSLHLFRMMDTEEDSFLGGILMNGQADNVVGLDDLSIPVSPATGTQSSPDAVVEILPQSRAKKSNNRTKRSKNFHFKEDEVLCSAWLNASKDSLNGANQTRTTFWGRVHAYFEEHKETATVRTESSIMHRWFTIQHQVNKFCGCYEAIKRRHQSGHTVTDMVRVMLCIYSLLTHFILFVTHIFLWYIVVQVSEACKLYIEQDKEKKKFTLIPCWNILKDQDKWAAKMVEIAELEKLEKTKKTQKAANVSRPRDEEETNTETAATDADGQETRPRKRSDGIKKVKANLRGGGAKVCAEAIDKMWAKKEETDKEKEKSKHERFVAALEVDKENLALEKTRAEAELKRADADQKRAEAEQKRAEAELLKQEKDIMLASNIGLNPAQLQWLKMMQEDIVAKRCGNQAEI